MPVAIICEYDIAVSGGYMPAAHVVGVVQDETAVASILKTLKQQYPHNKTCPQPRFHSHPVKISANAEAFILDSRLWLQNTFKVQP